MAGLEIHVGDDGVGRTAEQHLDYMVKTHPEDVLRQTAQAVANAYGKPAMVICGLHSVTAEPEEAVDS